MKKLFRWLALPPLGLLLAAGAVLGTHEWAVAQASRRVADIAYKPTTAPGFDAVSNQLDVYQPKKPAAPRPVVLFIHGGSWSSGSKDDFLYKAIGRRLARQGFVGVVISYRLAPGVLVPAQADDCAAALAWTVQHAAEYGGNPQRIILMGHSAGGGLAALLATGSDTLVSKYGLGPRAAHAVLLDDPAGLDMLDYLTRMEYPNDEQYLVPFSRDPAVWRQASALYHMRAGAPPYSLYIGGNTYPGIMKSAVKFRERLAALGQPPKYVVQPGKKHVPMVLQLLWPGNELYKELHRLAQ
ncbi:alpha/beta hydrolase [Hymenobacter sp. RP-2-7]|uniref:Alpha/beta hydrolase n=1 Tax=Hymenobacter polaris TaxID=2682546 RepID=A0A7Y0AFB3_9BACT|nr:alpha/beta hydrolase [Hymenobacter polaris]NML66035.1 alpha/beta hydrolase [Hymenobacter polaris]